MRNLFRLFIALVPLLRSAEGYRRDLETPSCPDPEDISPCTCSIDGDQLSMVCTPVTSEDELAEVFSAYFPFPTFKDLWIMNNNNIKTLRKGVFGPVSFGSIVIQGGALVEVEEEALSGSYSTATHINLQLSQISKFPFQDLHLFTALESLWLAHNSFRSIPPLRSRSLKQLYFGYNLINEVPVDTFKNLQAIQDIALDGNPVTTLEPGTFTELENLNQVTFGFSPLNHIPEGLITFYGPYPYFFINYNNISRVDVGAIAGLKDGMLVLDFNALTTLPEEVFRPILMDKSSLYITGNPFACGCDIAWLITDQNLHSQIDDRATCSDGRFLSALDPADFEHC